MGCTASTNVAEEEENAGNGEESFEMLAQSDPPAVHPSQSTFFTRHMTFIGHVVKTIVLGMAFNLFDVYSDVGSGLSHYQPKNVTRLFLANDTVPNYCIALPSTTTGGGQEYYKCLEEDTVWAAITFGCIQLPALVLALLGLVAALFVRCTNPTDNEGFNKVLAGAPLLMIVPFPLLVFTQQVASLFIQSDQMEFISVVFLFGEGALEASPQLLLLVYIIVSDAEREIPWIQKASVISSLISISKTAIELYVSESYSRGTYPTAIFRHRDSLDDSIMKDKSLCRKLWIMAKLSPAFIISLAFKVGSIAVICALLKVYAVIYLAIGIVITFIVAYNKYSGLKDEQAGSALFYSLTNTTILAKCPLTDRKSNYKLMMAVSITWLILHTTTLVTLMIWVGVLPASTHLDHWSSHRFALIQPTIFYPTIEGILLLGPLSILALWGLKRQVKALEENENGERTFWLAQYEFE
jgi:hypothetical protein